MQNQTFLKKLSAIIPDPDLHIIAENCCLAMDCLWYMGIEDLISCYEIISAERKNGGLENDCKVVWIPFFKHITGRDITVEFRDIRSLLDLKDVKGKCFVKYKYDKKEHWVVVEKCKIKYDPLDNSYTVANGRPVEARIIKLA